MADPGDDSLLATLKRVAAVLKLSEIPFALGGSFAVYAHGGHSGDHDVDFLIRQEDVDRALEALEAEGFTAERPPEDWLVKVYDSGRMVDLIHRPIETPVTDETFRETVVRVVDAIHMPVLSATQLMVHKLLSYSQHYCDFARGLPLARSLREQIDWERVRKETAHSPYAEAFLVLLDRLDVVPYPGPAGTADGAGETHEAGASGADQAGVAAGTDQARVAAGTDQAARTDQAGGAGGAGRKTEAAA